MTWIQQKRGSLKCIEKSKKIFCPQYMSVILKLDPRSITIFVMESLILAQNERWRRA